MKWRTHQAVGAARANSIAGTDSMAPRINVNHRREPPGSTELQASSIAAGHCTANRTAKVRCVLSVRAVTTS
jgi:hypothetical protein